MNARTSNRIVEAVIIKALARTIKDELNIRLVAGGAKPAAELFIGPYGQELLGVLGLESAQFGQGGKVIIANKRKTLEKFFSSYDSINESNVALGLLFGYPRDAVMAWSEMAARGQHDPMFKPMTEGMMLRNMAQARIRDLDVPVLLAYLDHIPALFDMVSGVVSEPSLDSARAYKAFVQTRYPWLARKIERQFRKDLDSEVRSIFRH